MRFILLIFALMLESCARLPRNTSTMTADQLLQQSTHVFIGVIEKHEIPNRFLFRVSGEDAANWQVVDMKVKVEMVLRGVEPRTTIDIYEAFPTGGLSGDWNLTQDNRRYLFPVRLDDGRYHLTRDFWRSVFPVYSGRHDRLPSDESRTLWERFALLQWWVRPDRSRAFGDDRYTDPGRVFGWWREAKVLRGLLRHPDKEVRLAACEDLLHMGIAQDECWDSLNPSDRKKLNKFWNAVAPEDSWKQNRKFETYARQQWDQTANMPTISRPVLTFDAINELRLFTTINNPTLRREFCAKFQKRFPQDSENGCPADRRPPATMVTRDGDIPLVGEWPKP
jgi:hypothetical protein